jgi:hypothetical protein
LASWASFDFIIEYWRLYQSGQFIHLEAVEEVVRSEAAAVLANGPTSDTRLRSDLAAPGYLNVINAFYRIIEVFEFAARLCEKDIYDNEIEITIELKGVQGFVLKHDAYHPRTERHAADADNLGRSWKCSSLNLIADRSGLSLKAAVWFFERFHWFNPPLEVLRREQQNFLRGLV